MGHGLLRAVKAGDVAAVAKALALGDSIEKTDWVRSASRPCARQPAAHACAPSGEAPAGCSVPVSP
jgi:hypothetical protein